MGVSRLPVPEGRAVSGRQGRTGDVVSRRRLGPAVRKGGTPVLGYGGTPGLQARLDVTGQVTGYVEGGRDAVSAHEVRVSGTLDHGPTRPTVGRPTRPGYVGNRSTRDSRKGAFTGRVRPIGPPNVNGLPCRHDDGHGLTSRPSRRPRLPIRVPRKGRVGPGLTTVFRDISIRRNVVKDGAIVNKG